MDYLVTLKDGSKVTLSDVDHYEQDGAGTRFFDDSNNLIASFYDGEVMYAFPASSTVEEPTPQEEPEV